MDRLYGREAESELVREFLERPEHDGLPRSRTVPVLIFTGARSSGKSALLGELGGRLDQRVPYASVDCESTDPGSVSDMLRAVAFELNRKCGQYGRIAFPRFVTGQIIMAQDLDESDPILARSQVEQTLEEHRNIGKLRAFLTETAPEIISGLAVAQQIPGISVAGRYLPDLILKGLVSWRRGRRVVLGEGQNWYGHQDRGLQRDPLDALVDLNRKAGRRDSEDDQREAAELLWAAFLADLRHGFQRHATKWTYNCVILLDNVDSPAGVEFVDGLIRARKQHAAHVDDPDPLTVVATSRGALSARVTAIGESVPLVGQASYDDYQRRSPGQRDRGCYPVRLRDLDVDEVGNMVAADAHPTSKQRITSAVYRLTQGHAGSTRLLLDAIRAHGGAPDDLRTVIDAPEPGNLDPEPAIIEQRLLGLFLHGVSEQVIDDLVTCAAARDLEQALLLSAHSGLLTTSPGERQSLVFPEELWPSAGDSARMPPVLRRLLLRRLGTDRPNAPEWSQTHEWLRQRRAADFDEIGSLYHTLALGDVRSVAERLSELLSERDVSTWLEMLTAIVAAPNQLAHQPADPTAPIMELTSWVEPQDVPLGPMARLVAALWIDADPLGDTHRQALLLNIAAGFDELAPHSRNGLSVLHGLAEKYRRDASMTE